MNQIFKVIWSVAANNWIVVSELQKSKGKTKSTGSKVLAASIFTIAALSGIGEAQSAVSIGMTEGTNISPAIATGSESIAIGEGASATNKSSVALGSNASSSGVNAYAIGVGANASGSVSYAIGEHSIASENKSIAIGGAAKSTGEKSIAIGDRANASNLHAFAMGGGSIASGIQTVAVGSNSESIGNYSVAIGNAAKANNVKSTAVGTDSNASGMYSAVLGANSVATGVGSVAIGLSSVANSHNSLAFGRESSTKENYAVAMGANSVASLSHSVALGAFSTTTASVATPNLNLNGIIYNFAGGNQSVNDVVSIGGGVDKRVRQIQNVAAGQINASSTDAINGSQLHALLTQGGWEVQANGRKVGEVNFGDKVNFKSTNNSVKITPAVEENGVSTLDLTIKTGNGLSITSDGDLQVVNTTISSNQGVIETPNNLEAYVKAGNLVNVVNEVVNSAREVVVGGTNVASVKVQGDNITGAKTYTVNVKGAKTTTLTNEIIITPVEADDNITDYQVNLSDSAKSSLNNANTAVQDFTVATNGQLAKTVNKTNNNVNFVNGAGTVAKADGENITFDANVDGTTIVLENGKLKANIPTVVQKTTTVIEGSNTHVKQEVAGDNTQYIVHADKSTVSVATALKLTETEDVNANTGVKTTNYHVDLETATKDNIQKGVDAHTTVTTKGLSFNTENGQTGEKKLGDTVNINGDGKNIQTKVVDGNVIVELKNEIQIDKATVGNTVIDNSGMTINNAEPAKTVRLTNNGLNNGGNKITNVADGVDDKDAVNMSQLNQKVEQLTTNINASKEDVKSTDKTVSIVKTVDDATQAATFDLSVNVDGQTITKDADGKVKAITEVVENNTNGTVKDPVSNTALATAKTVTDLINNSGFSIKTAGHLATGNEDPAKLVKTGEEVIFEAGDNLTVKRVGNQITYATDKVVVFDKVTVGDVVISADNINMGDNKITNVAEGTDDKDAVNVSQLNQKVEELTTNINASKENVKSIDKTVSIVKTVDDTTQATTFDLSVNVDGQTITKDADGKVKAITIDLENETNGTVKAPANNALVSAETVMNAINNSGFSIKTAGNLTTGNEDPAKLIKTGEEVIFEAGQNLTVKRIGNQITYETAKNVEFETVKANGVQVGDISVTAEKIDMGGKKITNLADGVDDKDAVNVSQLNQKVEQLTTNINASKEKVVSTDNSVSINETIDDATQAITFDLSVHIDNQTIKKDNGALKVNTVALENNDNGTVKDIPTADQNALTTAKDVANAINNSGFSIKTSGNLGEGNEVPVKLVKTGQEVDFSAGKNLTVKRVGNQITYETAKNVEFENVKASGVQVGDISVTAEKIDMGGKNITNVAAGVNGTDAVNVDQLTNAINTASAASKEDVVSTNKSVKINKTVDDVTKATTFDLAVNTDNKTIKTQADGTISAITEELTVNENGVVNTPVNADALVSGKTVANAINNSGFKIKSAGNKAQGDEASSKLIKNGEEVEFEAGDNLTVKRQGNKITYATAKNVAFESVKVKSQAGNTINIDGNSVTLNKNGNTDPAKEVRLSADGLNNGGNRITNVADGVEDNDAATVRQLKQSQQGIINQINDKMDQIAGNINRNDKRLRAGVAGTNAAVGLPQVYLPGKSMVAASVGTYRGENAIAVGYSRASDNGKVILKLQGNANTRKDFGGSVGVGYQW